ncbi:MAG: class I SAM-dependent rRNA methyltransferase [Bdellovibrionales bacterium]|nr:class I SAM-dependent rRNA methyltransferase [Bdellovibrionales bacterium]MCB0416065.1 class I SAM-dependent rRNA methyltransferase [Bdellovibrionales bacterium]
MLSPRFQTRRYQLKKQAVLAVRRRHPWVFRSQLSSAANPFPAGQWLRLYDHGNETLGFGIYDPHSVVGIRVLKTGSHAPTRDWLWQMVHTALTRRLPLYDETDALRLIHGENDGLPGIVLDRYGDVGVLQTYSASVDTLGRYVAAIAREQLGLRALAWRVPAKRKHSERGIRTLHGTLPSALQIREAELNWHVPLLSGQKGGAFLDLRGLRRWLQRQNLSGKTVLNLFSNTGTLGLSALNAGAKHVLNVDSSASAIEFGIEKHSQPGMEWKQADAFLWLREPPETQYDVVIVDPPQIVSSVSKVPAALRTYSALHSGALARLKPGGILVTCCCSSRLTRNVFLDAARSDLAPTLKLQTVLEPEKDHPVGFAEGDYLKIAVFSTKESGKLLV